MTNCKLLLAALAAAVPLALLAAPPPQTSATPRKPQPPAPKPAIQHPAPKPHVAPAPQPKPAPKPHVAPAPQPHPAPKPHVAPAPQPHPAPKPHVAPAQPHPAPKPHPAPAPQPKPLRTPARPLPPPPPAPRGSTTLQGWYDDFNRATAAAHATNRPILVLFTGSDWCPHCIRLHKGALSDPDFHRIARDYLVLVYCDSPSGIQLPRELQRQYRYLANVLRAGNGVPCSILLTPNGTEIGRIEGNPRDYLQQLHALLKRTGIHLR